MPGTRPARKGSFGGHLEELVKLFPEHQHAPAEPRHARSKELQEKIDIHALLFERAWELDRN